MIAREQWRPQLVSSSGEGEGALDELVSELGLEGSGYSRLGLKLGGRRVQLALERRGDDSGQREVEGVRLSVTFERAGTPKDSDEPKPSILLRREGQRDVWDKERGLTREVQTGYAGFDHAVFIDNDSSEADVRRVLATEATRQAVLRLLDRGHPSVKISSTGVSTVHRVRDGVVRAEPVLDALEDLLIVARAGGPKEAAPPRRGETLSLVMSGVSAACFAYGWLTWHAWPTSVAVLAIAAVPAAIVAFFSRPAIEQACSGDSSSARRATLVLMLAAFSTGALAFGALEHANGALDLSEGKLWRGVLTSRGSGRNSSAGVRWEDGSTSTIDHALGLREGDRITERRHPGALGFEWYDGRTVSSTGSR